MPDVLRDVLCQGRYCEIDVPDTIDLSERARLAINGMGGTIDPHMRFQMWFSVQYACKSPFMQHTGADTTCDPKYAESFPMMRIMCGSDEYADIEGCQNADLISRIKDGLYWNLFDKERPWYSTYNPKFDGIRKDEDLANLSANGRMLRALLIWREFDNNQKRDKLIRELVQGLDRIAIKRDEYAYYPDGGFGEPFNYPESGWVKTDEPMSETEGGEGSILAYHGHQIYALAHWYLLSGDRQALKLAERLTRFCMLPKFWGGVPDPDGNTKGLAGNASAGLPDPACIAGYEQGHWFSHFHARAIALRGILEYGRITGEGRVLEFVKRAYEYTWTLGIPRTGWINCYPVGGNVCEGCALGDIVAIGIRLTDSGMGDYWDDIDSVVRNHLIEQQLTNSGLLKKISDVSSIRKPEDRGIYPNQETEEDVIKRTVGIFAGHSTPVSIPAPWSMNCCTGNATQGLYYAWEGIVREDGPSAQINLLLNRLSKSLDIDSYLPYEGKVIVHNKTNRIISVRIPSWVERKELRCSVSGNPLSPSHAGNYIVFNGLKPGDNIKIEFPVKETTASYTVCSRTKMERVYRCFFRGSTLIDISPEDESPTSYQLYNREDMRKDKAPMKKITGFIPDKILVRW